MPQLVKRNRSSEKVVSICDSKLFGKTFKEGKFKLEVKESFYRGEEASVKECLDALEDATIANLVGSIVEEAVEAGYIDQKNVLEIDGVLHAQMARIE